MDYMSEHGSPVEISEQEAAPSRPRLGAIANLLTPSQRLLLSIFFFLDVCIICFACLFLFGKVGLPI